MALTSCSGKLAGLLGATANWVAVSLEPPIASHVAGGPKFMGDMAPQAPSTKDQAARQHGSTAGSHRESYTLGENKSRHKNRHGDGLGELE